MCSHLQITLVLPSTPIVIIPGTWDILVVMISSCPGLPVQNAQGPACVQHLRDETPAIEDTKNEYIGCGLVCGQSAACVLQPD